MKKSVARNLIKGVVSKHVGGPWLRTFRTISFEYNVNSVVATLKDCVYANGLNIVQDLTNELQRAVNNEFNVQVRTGVNQTIVITMFTPIDEAIKAHQEFQKLRMGLA